MTAVELDPVFVRALRLLHSRSKDSTSQLRSMLDDAIRHRKGLGPGPVGFSPGSVSPASPSQAKKNFIVSESSRKETEKRNLDRLKHELSELVIPSKRPRLDSPRSSSAGFSSSKSHTPSPTPPGSRGEGNGGGNSSEADDDLELDINLEGLNDCTCCLCKGFNQESGNKLMECHSCQNLYHQACHSPAVSNEEANDPRLVWHCAECSRTMPSLKPNKTVTVSNPIKTSVSSSLSSYKSSTSSARASPNKVSSSKPGLSSYKPASSKSGSSRSSRGVSSSSGSLSKSSNSGSSSSSSSSSSIDKRLQLMKKKANNRGRL